MNNIVPATGLMLRYSSGYTDGVPSIYFETFAPSEKTSQPTVVMIHGGGHSGACWTSTADGRPGWAQDLVQRGYSIVTSDWTGTGRSGVSAVDDIGGAIICKTLIELILKIGEPIVLLTHSMGGAYGWAVAEQIRDRLIAIIAVAPAPPGNMQPEPEIVATTAVSIELQLQDRRFAVPRSGVVQNERSAVENKLIGSSTQFPNGARNGYMASLLNIPSLLMRQRFNVAGTQVRLQDPFGLKGLPVLIVTGSEDPDHPREVDGAVVQWLRTGGATAEFMWLPDQGIVGNGHMMMIEQNSSAIAGVLCDWLDRITISTS